MKKQIFKKVLPIMLSAAMLSAMIPATDAAAAIKPTGLKIVTSKGKIKKKHILALGEVRDIKSTGKASVLVQLSPKNSSKGIRISSSAPKIVKVWKRNKAGTRWSMKGVSIGTADLTIRSAVKSTVKSSLSVTVTSKEPNDIKLSENSLTLNQDQSATIAAWSSSADVNVEFDSKGVDRYISVSSSDSSIVSTIKDSDQKYTIRALKAGTATITVASATDSDVSENITVTVKSKDVNKKPETLTFSARQTKKNQIYVTFSTPMTTTPSLSSFKLVQTGAFWDVALTGITLASEGKGAYINTAIDLQKNTKYDLTFTGTNSQPMTTQFTTIENKPAKIVLKTTSVVVNSPKKINYSLVDNNGIELIDPDSSKVEIIAETTAGAGYYDRNLRTLQMWVPNATARVKLIYHTGEYQNGIEQTITTEGVITATATSNTAINLERAITKKGSSALTDTQWAAGQNSLMIPARGSGYYLAAKLKSSENDYFFTDRPSTGVLISYTFESKNPDVLSVGNDGLITPQSNAQAGRQAVVVITVNYEGKTTQYSVTVSIGAESFPARVDVSPTTLYLKNGETKDIQLRIYDQYGVDISETAAGLISVQAPQVSGITVPTVNAVIQPYTNNKLICKITATGSTTGTVGYQITFPAQNNRVISSFGIVVTP